MLLQTNNIICKYKDGTQHSANRQNRQADILVFTLQEWWINACRLLWIFFRLHPQQSAGFADCGIRMWHEVQQRKKLCAEGTKHVPFWRLDLFGTSEILRWRYRVWRASRQTGRPRMAGQSCGLKPADNFKSVRRIWAGQRRSTFAIRGTSWRQQDF
jgi:hypothetical protein